MLLDYLSFQDIKISDLTRVWPQFNGINFEIYEQLLNDSRYAIYIERQLRDVENKKRDQNHIIPIGFDYSEIKSLSTELKVKLQMTQPANLDQASRIDGMTPVALALILACIRLSENKKTT